MEAILVMPSSERGRDFVLPLSLGGIRVRTVVQTGNQLVAEMSRETAECIFLPETLSDGPAEMWLSKVAAVSQRRPLAVVLVYGVEAREAVRERARTAYGPGVEVVAAGARNSEDVAGEASRVLDRLSRAMAEQDRDAYERLRQPVAPGTVPQPMRKSGSLAFLGASGGVGTSTLVANLAAYAAMAGQKVLLVDAQFHTAGSLLHYLGVDPDEQNFGIHHLRWSHASAQGAVRDSMTDDLTRRLEEVRFRSVRHADIRVLHVPAILEQMANGSVEQVTWAIQTLERSFDLVLVDCGSGLGDGRTLKLLEQASQVFFVVGGWGASVQALVRNLSALSTRKDTAISAERLYLLLREMGEGVYGARTVSSAANMPIYGRLPEEPLIRKADSRLGMRIPVVVDAPDSAYAQGISQVAYALGIVGSGDAQAHTVDGKKGWFGRRLSKRAGG
jgi:MinD-like ATPase involved in chromosome partitioning or flagellar assembly